MTTCNVCKGKGQTKACSTEFHFEPRKAPETGKQYVTDFIGSGCITCGGTGYVT